MKKTIAIVLPAHHEGGLIRHSLDKIGNGITEWKNRFPQYDFKIYITDDCSKDNTALVIKKWMSECEFSIFFHQNEKNFKLVQTLKDAYKRVLNEKPVCDYILKTDLDKDFDQEMVIEKLLPYTQENFGNTPFDIVIGNRKLSDIRRYRELERERRYKIDKIIKDKVGLIDGRILDPASVGSQLYRSNVLKSILERPIVKLFDQTNGLDFLIPLIAHQFKSNIKIVDIENCDYDPDRRPDDKIKKSYDVYEKIIDLCSHVFLNETLLSYFIE